MSKQVVYWTVCKDLLQVAMQELSDCAAAVLGGKQSNYLVKIQPSQKPAEVRYKYGTGLRLDLQGAVRLPPTDAHCGLMVCLTVDQEVGSSTLPSCTNHLV